MSRAAVYGYTRLDSRLKQRVGARPIRDPSLGSLERRIALSGGGTAGHVYPALAVAEAYRELVPRLRLLFVGTRAGTEARLVTRHGYRFAAIPGAPLYGVGAAEKLRAVRELAKSVVRARHLLTTERIQLVVGFGGYASAGTVLAARSLGLPCAIHEPNLVPGLTNRILARFASRVYVGFEASRAGLGRSDALVTGTPVRPEILRVGAERRQRVRADADPAHVLITGGSLGSAFLNRHAPAALGLLAASGVALEVRHQSGSHDPEPIQAAYRQAGVAAEVSGYIDAIADTYAWADAGIVCAGAITLAELAAAALPAVLVPLATAAGDHQRFNARVFAAATGLPWIRERDWRDETVAVMLGEILRDEVAAQRVRALAPAAAAETVVRDCERTLGSTPS